VLGTAALLPLLLVGRARRVLSIDQHARVPVVEISLLRRIPLFGMLPGPAMEALAQSLERVHFESGQTLVREGEPGEAYYALAEGTVEVTQGGKHVRFLGRAEGLGEIALLRAVPRTATAVATTPVTAYQLSREPFLRAVTGHAATLESADHVVRAHVTGDVERRRALPDDGTT
jgi:CRP-like cAMP-binding protein